MNLSKISREEFNKGELKRKFNKREEFRIGDKVKAYEKARDENRLGIRIVREGRVLGIYKHFILVEFEGGKALGGESLGGKVEYYRECFKPYELDKVEEE